MNEVRLIDANALIGKLREVANHHGIGGCIASIVIKLIEDMPTIDPERHGRWVKVSGCQGHKQYECFECHTKAHTDDWDDAILSDYCPKCGSRMDGENEYGKKELT